MNRRHESPRKSSGCLFLMLCVIIGVSIVGAYLGPLRQTLPGNLQSTVIRLENSQLAAVFSKSINSLRCKISRLFKLSIAQDASALELAECTSTSSNPWNKLSDQVSLRIPVVIMRVPNPAASPVVSKTFSRGFQVFINMDTHTNGYFPVRYGKFQDTGWVPAEAVTYDYPVVLFTEPQRLWTSLDDPDPVLSRSGDQVWITGNRAIILIRETKTAAYVLDGKSGCKGWIPRYNELGQPIYLILEDGIKYSPGRLHTQNSLFLQQAVVTSETNESMATQINTQHISDEDILFMAAEAVLDVEVRDLGWQKRKISVESLRMYSPEEDAGLCQAMRSENYIPMFAKGSGHVLVWAADVRGITHYDTWYQIAKLNTDCIGIVEGSGAHGIIHFRSGDRVVIANEQSTRDDLSQNISTNVSVIVSDDALLNNGIKFNRIERGDQPIVVLPRHAIDQITTLPVIVRRMES